MSSPFSALVLEQDGKTVSAGLKSLEPEALPAGDVTVAVEYTTLNYKDGLILTGQGRLVRTYPHVGGIDFAGTVEQSDHPGFEPGDRVVLNGWRVGETHWGGYAQKARVKGDWLVPLPSSIDTRHAMAIGTAGYTAMLCVMALEEAGLHPGGSPVLVTGASGGVGSVAVALLAKLGFEVTAATGRPENADYLRALGASALIDRAEIAALPEKPLQSERWQGAVDSVGDATLAHVLSQVSYGGAVAACGLAGGNQLPTTVLPFILRGVRLLGIDSVMCPAPRRTEAWRRLALDLRPDLLDAMIQPARLADLPRLAADILKGQVRGRVVVDVNA